MPTTTSSTPAKPLGSENLSDVASSVTEKLTSDQFNLFSQTTSEDSPECIASPVSESGTTRFVKQAGQKIAKFGAEVAPANPSARPANAKAKRMKGIYGQSSFDSSPSDDLSWSLANKLRAVTDLNGSTMYTLTWEAAITLSGLRLPRLAATALRTDESACTSWPSPRTSDTNGAGEHGDGGMDLRMTATLAQPWATPASRDWRDGRASDETMDRNSRPLNEQTVQLTPWATPHCPREHDSEVSESTYLGREAQLTASGVTPSGSTAATKSTGQLNPRHSAWMMGLPQIWDECAMAIVKSRTRSCKAQSGESSG